MNNKDETYSIYSIWQTTKNIYLVLFVFFVFWQTKLKKAFVIYYGKHVRQTAHIHMS